ncbi:hypothetical protein JCM18899A_15860 [Nocardioides sp. AN3]
MRRAGDQGGGGSVRAVDLRTGRTITLLLDGRRLQVVEPDRTSDRGDSVTEFATDELVLAGTVAGRVRGRGGAWALTRTVSIDDPQWGSCAPAWSWVLLPEESPAGRRAAERFVHDLRAAMPQQRWVRGIRLSKVARKGSSDAAGELLELARQRDPEFAARCDEIVQERLRRGFAHTDHAEQVLLDALQWRAGGSAATSRS